MTQKPPELKNISQCIVSLDFGPFATWPQALPAVAVNGYVLAGFQQQIVFDHAIDFQNSEEIAQLFRSLYFDLSAVELAHLVQNAQPISWFPLEDVFGKYSLRWNEQIESLASAIFRLPLGFQKFCAERKWSFADFSPLLSAPSLMLEPLFLMLVHRRLSRAAAVQIFELYIELRLSGQTDKDIIAGENENSDQWLARLKRLRYPQIAKHDKEAEHRLKSLPWPGTSSVRWLRQGDRAGIELKLFVAEPTDLKKYVQSLAVVQEVLEKEALWKKH